MSGKEERNAMNLLIKTLVDKVDAAGQGVELIEKLGQENFKALMGAYRECEGA